MNSSVKSTALGAMLSLAMVTNAGATQPDSNAATSVKSAETQSLMAQTQKPFRDSRPYRDFVYERRFLDEMIMQRMKMVGTAQEMLQSTKDSEIRKMAQEMITSGNSEIARMVEMRKKMFLENPDID